MKMMKLLSVLLILLTATIFVPASLAASKADKQKQAQQKKADKKQIEENKRIYKKVEKPKLKERKAENKKAQKLAKKDRKQAINDLDQSYQDVVKFYKARNGAKAVLLKQHQQMQNAIKNYEENPSPKTLKARDRLVASYANSYKNYQDGPRKQWLNKVNAFKVAADQFDNKDRSYKKALEDSATIARDKIKAKAAIKIVKKPVEESIYDVVPIINSAVKIETINNQRFVSTGSVRDHIYGAGPAILPIYDRVPSQQEYDRLPPPQNYADPNSPLEL
jgi:hypothetical protein